MHSSLPPSLRRHFDFCNNIRLPAGRLPFYLADQQVGWIDPEILPALTEMAGIAINPAGVSLANPAALADIAHALAVQGHYTFRDEAFDVCAEIGAEPITTIDRGALPAFGIAAVGVHVNGLVRRSDGLHLWVARRAANKLLDPGKLDHLVAGGVSAGMTPFETLIKEAGEEAAIGADLAGQAVLQGRITYTMMRDEGLRRDTLFCYDLELPEDFSPVAADGEVEAFELWPISEVVRYVAETDEFKFNVNLVLIDLFERLGLAA